MKLSEWIFLGICALALGSTPAWAEADLKLPRERITLVAPPLVHAHDQIAKSGPKIVEFKLTAEEQLRARRIDDAVAYHIGHERGGHGSAARRAER